MPTQYRDWAPTGFDRKGAFIYDHRQEWYVVPVIKTRDSGVFEESQFETARAMLDDEKIEYEILSMGHWGPGWIEVIITPDIAFVEKVEASLEDYPLLSEDDYYERSYNAACEYWERCSIRDRICLIKEEGRPTTSIFAARRDTIPEDDDRILEYLESVVN